MVEYVYREEVRRQTVSRDRRSPSGRSRWADHPSKEGNLGRAFGFS